MATNPSTRHATRHDSAVIQWLLEGDPAIRWQTLRDLTSAPGSEVAAEHAKVATEGWGARLLALQGDDGAWAGVAWNRGWDSTMHVLTLLREMGLDPASDQARRAVALVRDHVHWQGWDWDGSWKGEDFEGTPFFVGEVEPCINGQMAATGAYFGQDIQRAVTRLLGEQLADGGWNCEAENGSTRASFNTTICVLEALLEVELAAENRSGVALSVVRDVRLRGQEYLLERHLQRRKTTGEVIARDRMDDNDWTRFAYPNWWHYDVLRGLDYLRHAGATPEARVADAVALVAAKRGADGRWLLDNQYPGTMPVALDAGVGQPSRWITLRALRVLDWYAGAGAGE